MLSKKDKLHLLIKHFGRDNNSEFARYLGVSPQTISSWLSRNTFDIDLIYAKCIDVSADWLLGSKGSMLCPTDGESTTVQAESTVIYRDNPDKEEIMQLLREQNAQLKEQIAELKKPKFCGVPINMSNTPPVEPSPPAVAESKPTSPKPPKKIPTKSEIHT